jgi:hypothetical protein
MDETFSLSLRESQAKHWELFASGAVASIAGFVLPALGFAAIPPKALLWIGLGLIFVAVIQTFHDVRLERDRFAERLKPCFEMGDSDPACYQSGENSNQGRYQMRRVTVSNTGGLSVDGVRVSLVNIRSENTDCGSLRSKMPLPLIPQHMGDATPHYTFSLAPSETRPIDVFAIGSAIPMNFQLFHCVPGVDKLILGHPDVSYLLDIQVVGENAPALTRVVRIGRDAAGPTLSLLS